MSGGVLHRLDRHLILICDIETPIYLEAKVRSCCLLLLNVTLLPFTSMAQSLPLVDDSTTLQVWHSCDSTFATQKRSRRSCRDRGMLASSTADSLVLISEGQVNRVAIPWSTVLGVNQKTGRKVDSHRFIALTFGGAVVGGIAGALYGYSTCAPCDGELDALAVGEGVLYGTGIGLIAGLVTGLIWKTDRWEAVPSDRLKVSFSPSVRGRSSVGLSINF